MIGVWVAVGAVVVALAFGLYRQRVDGRFTQRGHGGHGGRDRDLEAPPAPLDRRTWHGHELGERATLIQFSSAFCAPCRVTRRVLEDVAATEPGITHIDIDAEQELALVRELGIARTPTTLVLDAAGTEIARAAGAPRKEQVLAALPPQ